MYTNLLLPNQFLMNNLSYSMLLDWAWVAHNVYEQMFVQLKNDLSKNMIPSVVLNKVFS